MFRTRFQYDVHIIFSHRSISYDNYSHFVQHGGLICEVNCKTGHCPHCSCDQEWLIGGFSAFCPSGLATSPAQLYEHQIKLMFTLGKKQFCTRRLSFKCWFNLCFSIQRLTRFCIYDVHITVFRCIAVQVLYETSFHTIIMWMRGKLC